MSVNNIEYIIDKICQYNKSHDSFDNYRKLMFCIEHCLNLLSPSIFSEDELSMLNTGINIWHNKYDREKLHEINLRFSRIWATHNYEDKIKDNAMQAAAFILTPYEGWSPETYLRPFAFEYFMGYMLYTNVDWNTLCKIIIEDYTDLIDF